MIIAVAVVLFLLLVAASISTVFYARRASESDSLNEGLMHCLRASRDENNEILRKCDKFSAELKSTRGELARLQTPFQGKGHRCEVCGKFVSPLSALAVLDDYAKWQFYFYHHRCFDKLIK